MSLKLLAVSGGIDSMTMLHSCWESYAGTEELFNFVVVTVDHGMRPSSAEDAEFVRRVVRGRYEMKCHVIKLELGPDASEAEAREARYAAMEEYGRELTGGGILGYDFEIWTAHHLEDLVESIAINCLRGTGWRGLAVLRREGVERPLLGYGEDITALLMPKNNIYKLADYGKVRWRLDPTNYEDKYLRNRLREKVYNMPLREKAYTAAMWEKQCFLAGEIDCVVAEILTECKDGLPREWFLAKNASGKYRLDDAVADEILRGWLLRGEVRTTRPQRADFLKAIREYKAGKLFNLPGDRMVKIGKVVRWA